MGDVCIKAGSYCPVCRGMPLSDCRHPASAFNARDVRAMKSRALAAESERESTIRLLADAITGCDEQRARAERAESERDKALRGADALYYDTVRLRSERGTAWLESATLRDENAKLREALTNISIDTRETNIRELAYQALGINS